MKQRAKSLIMLECLVLMIIGIGSTIAFYSNDGGTIENETTVKSSSVYLQELFDPGDYWVPGETKQKELNFGNNGERDQVIRFRIETKWVRESGGIWEPSVEHPVEIKWTDALLKEWTKFTGDDWYYYNKILSKNSETAQVMEAVKFSEKLSNDKQVGDFTHATYQITIYMESLDVDSMITREKWGKTFGEGEELVWQE